MDVLPEEPEPQPDPVERYSSSSLLKEIAPDQWLDSLGVSKVSIMQMTGSSPTVADSYPCQLSSRRKVTDQETTRKVEILVAQILQSLQSQEDTVSIALRTKKRCDSAFQYHSPAPSASDRYKISYPGNTPQEAWRFSTAELAETVCRRTASMLTCSPAVVLRILELIHEALVNNVIVSKRNIYYKDPELFKSQKIVDRYVDILSYTFGCERAALNVAMLIDNVDNIRSIDVSDVSWILVVEKESTFRTIDSSKVHEDLEVGKGIVLTAKGYPDVSTRAFLRLLSVSAHPPLPIFALIDYDPDGMAIMSVYKHGSLTLSHEKANLKTPTVRWLGIRSEDLSFDQLSGTHGNDSKGLLTLSVRDRRKAVQMLGWRIFEEDGVEQEWRRQLQVMLMLNTKVEMEILSEREGGFEGWVEERLSERLRARGFV
ncbi:MAG: hypothetical protein Q9181_003675 [Wetmoreana brouardii]